MDHIWLQAIDVLTPLGRGQAQLLTGPRGSGKALAAVDTILGQVRISCCLQCRNRSNRTATAICPFVCRVLYLCAQNPSVWRLQAGSGVRCVYASVGQTAERQQAAIEALQGSGAMAYTTVVAAPEGGPGLSSLIHAFAISCIKPEGEPCCLCMS